MSCCDLRTKVSSRLVSCTDALFIHFRFQAKEAAQREAAQVAQRRANDEKAAAIERERAAEFEKKQKAVSMKQQQIQKEQGKNLYIAELRFP